MKAAEKEQIFDLLKKASGAATGYTAANFSQAPAFSDDIEQQPQSVQSEGNFFKSAAGNTIEEIAQNVAACHNCVLAQTRHNVVPGEGVATPAVLVVGEGPGADEDAQGRPFVGKAGQLLDKMLGAIGLYRNKNCFIANIVKCRPPMNRDPSPEECAACSRFIQAQISVLRPRMILAVGRIALQRLLDTPIGITKMRGQIVDYKGIPFMATYHPSALLRDETLKRPAWEDLKKFKTRLLELCPDYENVN